MKLLICTVLLAITNANAAKLRLPSFRPPQYPLSTLENDGSNIGRYDVRKTMALVIDEPRVINCWYFLLWLATDDGSRYHFTINPCMRGNATMAGIYAMDNLKNLTSTASSPVGPGSGSSRSLNVLSQHLNLTSPMGSDNFGDLRLAAKWKGVETDMRLTPTGKNLFIGGSGGFTLPSYGGDDYQTLIPGYTWYWGNPTMAVDGSITIDGKTSQIDTQNSFGYFERQWGDFNLTAGYVALWAYLPNGDLLHTWVVGPDVNGHGSPAISTVWHPDGRHEVLAVDFTRGSDIWVSKETGKSYFTEFEVGSSTAHSRLRMRQYSQATEVLPENDQGSIISEAYSEGEGSWEGQPVKFFGHMEQYSSWYWL